MKIAILYICTGKYNQFFKDFFNSCEKYFLVETQKIYYVWSDDYKISDGIDNVIFTYKKCDGFPLDSLFRFDMFLQKEKEILNNDYVFFFNANMLFVDNIGFEFLPKKDKILAVLSPGYYKRPACMFPYENNPISTAYIKREKKQYHYYMGSLNGGTAEEYLKLIKECSKNIHIDYNNNHIAKYHDESHLNKYLTKNDCLALSPAYAYPEGSKLPFLPKIIIRNKVKIDIFFDKQRKHSLSAKFVKAFKLIINAARWYFLK